MYSAWCLVCVVLCCLSFSDAGLQVDLTHPFNASSQYWFGYDGFEFTRMRKQYLRDGTWYTGNDFSAGEHGGTHLDAPYHFSKTGWKVGQIPLNRLIVPGVLVDVSSHTKTNRDYQLRVKDLEEWEDENGEVPEGSAVLIDFGWAQYYWNRARYFGTSSNNASFAHFPGVSTEAAQWLVNKNVVGVGIDVPSIDYGQAKLFPTHRILQEANIYVLENVALNYAEDVPPTGFTLLVLPMKIEEGTGAPVRLIATDLTPSAASTVGKTISVFAFSLYTILKTTYNCI